MYVPFLTTSFTLPKIKVIRKFKTRSSPNKCSVLIHKKGKIELKVTCTSGFTKHEYKLANRFKSSTKILNRWTYEWVERHRWMDTEIFRLINWLKDRKTKPYNGSVTGLQMIRTVDNETKTLLWWSLSPGGIGNMGQSTC